MTEETLQETLFDELANALDRLPNGFPRTESNVEIAMLKKLFTAEEAELVLNLTGKLEPITVIAERAGIPVEEAAERLGAMAQRWMVFFEEVDSVPCFRMAPFVVGIYEGYVGNIDHEFAHLFERYLLDGGMAGIMGVKPALHRVVPARNAERKTDWILPYEDVKALLEKAETFRENECICRKQRDLIGKGCDYPKGMCLGFSMSGAPAQPGDITRDEALALLDRAQEAGLVHAVGNSQEGVGYVCNCCGCCCGVLGGITRFGIEGSVARSSYFAIIDPEDCIECGVCGERCHVDAIKDEDGTPELDRDLCIGCGVCATGCPTESIVLERRPDSEIVEPPLDFGAWEQERLKNRGLAT